MYPYLSYCIQIWGGTYKSYLHRLHSLQRKAIRCICFLRKYDSRKDNNDSVSERFTDLSILSLSNIYHMELNIFMFKYTKNTLPKIFANYFPLNNEIHNHNTRSANQLRVIRYGSVLGHNSFHYNAIKIWNNIGHKLYEKDENISFNCFKKKIKSFLLEQQ